MDLHAFSAKWFFFYYCITGLLMLGSGGYLILKNHRINNFLQTAAGQEKPPRLLITILKYFALFTLPGLALSFFPFSIIELLFTLWSLLLVYIAGIRLVRWGESRRLIKAQPKQAPDLIRKVGAIMVAVGFSIFLLAYLVITQSPI